MIQQTIEDVPEQQWDVIVIGAGPAGAIAAWYLASRGHQTLLLDQARFPREKICGDGLNHDALRFLKKIGFYEEIRAASLEIPRALVYSTGGIELEVPGPYLTIRRKEFDFLLAQKAVQAGATFACAKVRGFSQEREGHYAVCLAELEKPLQTQYIILATGAITKLATFLGLTVSQFPTTIAVRCYLRSSEKFENFIGSYDPAVLPGYGWIFPMGDGLYNAGVIAYTFNGRPAGANLKQRFDKFMHSFPIARKIKQSGELISPLVGFPLNCGLPKTVTPGRGNLLATGETIGSTFHFTGEGIGKAMETGELAAEVVHGALSQGKSDIVVQFQAKLDQQLRSKYLGYCAAERWLAIPWLNDFLARRMLKNPTLRDDVINIIVNEVDPRQAFSIKGVLRSLRRG